MRITRLLPTLARSTLLAALCLGLAQAQTAYRWVDKDGKVHYSDQPPPPSASSHVAKRRIGANVVDTSGPSYESQVAARNAPLTLYTSTNCIRNCELARDFLNRRGAVFGEKIIATQADVDEFRKATGIEELSVPVLQAGAKSEKGFEENAWHALLDAAGYPRAAGKEPAR